MSSLLEPKIARSQHLLSRIPWMSCFVGGWETVANKAEGSSLGAVVDENCVAVMDAGCDDGKELVAMDHYRGSCILECDLKAAISVLTISLHANLITVVGMSSNYSAAINVVYILIVCV